MWLDQVENPATERLDKSEKKNNVESESTETVVGEVADLSPGEIETTSVP